MSRPDKRGVVGWTSLLVLFFSLWFWLRQFFFLLFFFPPGLDFIRAEGFVFSHVADEGIINACAGNLLRYRKQVGAENIQIFADIKKKHR